MKQRTEHHRGPYTKHKPVHVPFDDYYRNCKKKDIAVIIYNPEPEIWCSKYHVHCERHVCLHEREISMNQAHLSDEDD